jgi:hypothetical protein
MLKKRGLETESREIEPLHQQYWTRHEEKENRQLWLINLMKDIQIKLYKMEKYNTLEHIQL